MLHYYADACLSLLSTGGKQQVCCQSYFAVRLCPSQKGECALVCRSSILDPAFYLTPAIIFRPVDKSLWQMLCTRQADPAQFAGQGVGVWAAETSVQSHLPSSASSVSCLCNMLHSYPSSAIQTWPKCSICILQGASVVVVVCLNCGELKFAEITFANLRWRWGRDSEIATAEELKKYA